MIFDIFEPKSEVFNMDNMEFMRSCKDGQFDLAIVDPPYGINFGKFNRTNKTANGTRYKSDKYKNSDWDKGIPTNEYFDELFRISKNQIIWGGNYFPLPPTQCFIFWYKKNPVNNFSDGEFAWTSFKKPALCFEHRYYGNLDGNSSAKDKIHPTQKPIELYQFCLDRLAKEGDSILDTHLGSGSSRIACWDMKFDFTGIELDKEYFDASVKRFNEHKKHIRLL